MKIVILDGFAANPGDISWEGLKALGECTIYDRTAPEEVLERSAGAEVILTNKVYWLPDTTLSIRLLPKNTVSLLPIFPHTAPLP